MQTNRTNNKNPLTSLSQLQTTRQASSRLKQRRPTPEEGQALEILTHAVEYLIDGGLLSDQTINLNVAAAVQMLSQASRAVYLGCAEAPQTVNRPPEGTTHIRWTWMPTAPFMLPMFRVPSAPLGSQQTRV